jgi:hypothetical protein
MAESRRATVLVVTPEVAPTNRTPAAEPRTGALSGDEPQRVRRPYVIGPLVHHREEHPQVIGGRQHRVRPTPTLQELQIVIEQRHPEPHNHLAGWSSRTDQTRIEQGHLGASSTVDKQPQRLLEMSGRITCITSG